MNLTISVADMRKLFGSVKSYDQLRDITRQVGVIISVMRVKGENVEKHVKVFNELSMQALRNFGTVCPGDKGYKSTRKRK
jgi:hypothetical protein